MNVYARAVFQSAGGPWRYSYERVDGLAWATQLTDGNYFAAVNIGKRVEVRQVEGHASARRAEFRILTMGLHIANARFLSGRLNGYVLPPAKDAAGERSGDHCAHAPHGEHP